MPDTKPLSHICSTLNLNSYQQEEFDRISGLYNRVYNHLLAQWYSFAEKKSSAALDGQDFKFIERTVRDLPRKGWLCTEEDRVISEHAASELERNLQERLALGLPLPHPDTAPMTKFSDEVVFYWGYDVKVKEHTARVPVLGKATTGRFRFFSGSIRAIGVRRSAPDEFQCVVYHRDNEKCPVAPVKTTNVWQVGADPIPQSPLNQRLRAAGIGFMA